MQIYCGTDIIEVSRIQDAVENTKGFKENVYTKNEIEDIDKILFKGYVDDSEKELVGKMDELKAQVISKMNENK